MLPLGSADLDEVATLYADETVMDLVDGGTRTREQSRSALAAAERCWKSEGWGLWAIRDATTGGLVGEGGLQHLTDVDGAVVDFGITIARRHWGGGFATEAGHVILLDAWDRYDGNLIHAVTDPANAAGAAVLRKLGFRRVADHDVRGTTRHLWEIPRLA